jgi:MOSC domain-containing protein YiiM/ferredoxin-NADP reductase
MHVLSVNLPELRTIEVKGKPVSTSIFREQAPGRHVVRRLGIEGDFRVASRKAFGEEHHAVYVYPHEHYAHWEALLQRGPFAPGQFGENITASGLLEGEARIGDVLRFGSAVLQIAHPRTPCRNLDARMNAPRFARRFLESRRVGYYMRVLEEGAVEAADHIDLLERDEGSPTVDDFVRIALFDYWDVDGLRYLLRARDLVPAWRELLEAKVERAGNVPGWVGRREMVVSRRVDEGPDLVSFHLRCARGKPLPSFAAGQFLTLAVRTSPSAEPSLRSYAISSPPDELDTYRISVQKVPDARSGVAAFLHAELGEGARVAAESPRGVFTLDAAHPGCDGLLFVAREVGLSSVISILHAWAAQGARMPVRVLHFDRESSRTPLHRELDRLKASVGSLDVQYVLQADGAPPGLESIDGPSLLGLIPGSAGDVYVVGASWFVDAVRSRLDPSELEPARLHVERYR